MTVRDLLWCLVGRRSDVDWREVRPTRREWAMLVLVLALLVYLALILFWSGIDNHCLWDHEGSRCVNGGG